MKTITLTDTPLTLETAINWIKEGRCLGIKPGANTNYMVINIPERGPQRLYWAGQTDGTMMIEQITGEWFPVIADHRTFQPTTKPQ